LAPGERSCCALSSAEGLVAPQDLDEAGHELHPTTRYWRVWLGGPHSRPPFPHSIQRSALVIKVRRLCQPARVDVRSISGNRNISLKPPLVICERNVMQVVGPTRGNPVGTAGLVVLIAVAQSTRELSSVEEIKAYPG